MEQLIFTNPNNNWKQLGDIVFGQNSSDRLGTFIDCNANGTRIIAGAQGYQVNGVSQAGQAVVYELVDSQWTQLGSDFQGEFLNGILGRRVAMNAEGDIVAVSHPKNNDRVGTIQLYKWSRVKTWELIHTVEGDDVNDGFSHYMGMSRDGSTVFGMPQDRSYLKIHKKHNGTWVESKLEYSVLGEPTLNSDGNGFALIVDGYGGGNDSAVVVFEFNKNTSSWEEKSSISNNGNLSTLAINGVKMNANGSVVALSVIGDSSGNDANVQVYRHENSSWSQVGQDIPEIEGIQVKAVSVDGKMIGISSPGFDNSKGRALIYSLDDSNQWVEVASIDGVKDGDNCGNHMCFSECGDFAVCSRLNDEDDNNDNDEGCFAMYMNSANIDGVDFVQESIDQTESALQSTINNKLLKMVKIKNYRR